jgi:cytochrome c oxidase subunit 2
MRILADDSAVLGDDAYLRNSIRQPHSQIVKGYAAAMPPFAHLEDVQIDHLVAYLKSLK